MTGRKIDERNARFMKPTDESAFDRMEVCQPRPDRGLTQLCRQCQGHGGWILRRDVKPGIHFHQLCDQCNGYGYIKPVDADHVHDWVAVRNEGTCLTRERCAVDGC